MIRLVGMGPGSMRHITCEVFEAIKKADKVIAFGRISKAAVELGKEIHQIQRVEEVDDMLDENCEIAILASGDPCFFGILDYLKRKGIQIDEVLPGISSMQYMMAKLKKSWHDAALVSFHGRECGIDRLRMTGTAVILTDSKYTPNYISHYLRDMGVKGRIFAGFNLSYEDELIIEAEIGADIVDVSTLAVVVTEHEMD